MRQVTHALYQSDYDAGYQAMQDKISRQGFKSARDEFNALCPPGVKQSASMPDYYRMTGGVDALLNALPN